MIRAADFFRGPLTTALAPGELVTKVRFPLPPGGAGCGFAEVARRHGDFALVGGGGAPVASRRGPGGGARLALFGVADTAVRSGAA